MSKLLKSAAAILCIIVLATGSAAATNDSFIEKKNKTFFSEKEISEWNSKTCLSKNQNPDIGESVFLHNNGNQIKNDIFADGKSEGNLLVGVLVTNFNGREINNYLFSNQSYNNRGDLIKFANKVYNDRVANIARIPMEKSADTYYNTYNWEYRDGSVILSRLSTAVNAIRKTSNAVWNNRPASIWDLTAFTQFEKVETARINGYRTRLNVSESNQTLLAYGPYGNSSGGSVTVGLSGGGVPSVGYNFSISGFSLYDLSSMSGNYGRWKFWDNFGSLNSITTEPGIRAANASGYFVAELSHVSSCRKFSNNLDQEYNTGVIQIWIPDR